MKKLNSSLMKMVGKLLGLGIASDEIEAEKF